LNEILARLVEQHCILKNKECRAKSVELRQLLFGISFNSEVKNKPGFPRPLY